MLSNHEYSPIKVRLILFSRYMRPSMTSTSRSCLWEIRKWRLSSRLPSLWKSYSEFVINSEMKMLNHFPQYQPCIPMNFLRSESVYHLVLSYPARCQGFAEIGLQSLGSAIRRLSAFTCLPNRQPPLFNVLIQNRQRCCERQSVLPGLGIEPVTLCPRPGTLSKHCCHWAKPIERFFVTELSHNPYYRKLEYTRETLLAFKAEQERLAKLAKTGNTGGGFGGGFGGQGDKTDKKGAKVTTN